MMQASTLTKWCSRVIRFSISAVGLTGHHQAILTGCKASSNHTARVLSILPKHFYTSEMKTQESFGMFLYV